MPAFLTLPVLNHPIEGYDKIFSRFPIGDCQF
jgi:hypothetical protein